jgi:hypothetical protein
MSAKSLTYCSVHGEQEPGSQFCPICGTKLGKRASLWTLVVCLLIACAFFFAWVAIQKVSGIQLPPASIYVLILATLGVVSALAKLVLLIVRHEGAIRKVLLWTAVLVASVIVPGIAINFVAWALGCSLAMAVLILLVASIAAKK